MKYLFTLMIALLPLTIIGQGSSIRALNGLGTNITLRGQNIIRTNLLVDAMGSATISPTNIFEGLWTNGLKVLNIGRNTGLVYFGTNTVYKETILDSSRILSISPTLRLLAFINGNTSVDWLNGYLYDENDITLNWLEHATFGTSGFHSMDWGAGKLYDTTGVDVLSIDWINRTTSGAWAFTGASGNFTNSVTTSNLTVNGTASNLTQVIVYVSSTNSILAARANSTYRCTGTTDYNTVSNAMASLTSGGVVHLSAGTYNITSPLTVPTGIILEGEGVATLLVANPTNGNTLNLSSNVTVRNLKIQGPASTEGTANNFAIVAGNNAALDNLWIDQCWSGINVSVTNAIITNLRASNLRSTNGWANAISSSGGDGIFVQNSVIENCDRAFEPEDGTRNFFAQNGRISNCYPAKVATLTFTIGAHTHDATSTRPTENITYDHFYLENSGGIAVDAQTNYFTRNITFNDITINNPWRTNSYNPISINGDNVTLRRVKLYGTAGWTNNIHVGSTVNPGVHNLLIDGIESIECPTLFTSVSATNTVISNGIFDYSTNDLNWEFRLTGSANQNFTFNHCTFNNIFTNGGLQLSSGSYGVRVQNSKFFSTGSRYAGQDVVGAVWENNLFKGNWLIEALDINADNAVIRGNTFDGITNSSWGFANISSGKTNTIIEDNRGLPVISYKDNGTGTLNRWPGLVGDGAGITNVNYDSFTNLWVADSSFTLGQTNYFISQGAATVGMAGVLNRPTSTARFGELYILATGTVIFTNPAAWKTSDGVDSRTITNGNAASISVQVIPGIWTNLLILQTW